MENHNYYKSYYSAKKHLYKLRYEEKKIENKARLELYKPYGGEIKYYTDKIKGFCKIKNDE